MAHFVPSPGYANCPKCFGWQIRDLTKRDVKGWPLEPENIVDCDHCGGCGELPAKPAPIVPWQSSYDPKAAPIPAAEPKRRKRRAAWTPPAEINDIDDAKVEGLDALIGKQVVGTIEHKPGEAPKVEIDWGKPLEPGPVSMPAPAPVKTDRVTQGWGDFDAGKKAVDNPDKAATGWPIFNKEPGK